VIVAAAGACVKIEPFRGVDDGGAGSDGSGSDGGGMDMIPKAIATMTAGRVTVEVAGLYKMEFSEQQFHFPDKLTIRGVDVMDPPQASCNLEHGTGVTWTPGGTFSSWDSGGLKVASMSTINIDFDGVIGGIAKVRLDWAAPFEDPDCASMVPSGRSTFTFFPDGRIQRMDTANLGSAANAGMCGQCETATNWDIASYYAFDEADVKNLIGVTRPPAGDGNQTMDATTICFNDENKTIYQVAIGWWQTTARRMRRVGTGLAAIANYTPITQNTSTGLLGDTSTAMIIDADDDCTTLVDRVQPYVNGTTLEITGLSGSTDFITMGQDGIFGGEHSGNPTPFGRQTDTQPTVIMRAGSGSLGPFAVWLNIASTHRVASVTRTPASTRTQWYTQEQLRDSESNPISQYLFYFADGLSGSDQITVNVVPK